MYGIVKYFTSMFKVCFPAIPKENTKKNAVENGMKNLGGAVFI